MSCGFFGLSCAALSNTIWKKNPVALRLRFGSLCVLPQIFGVGNHHWTKSRESVGLRLVNVFAERLGWRWSRLPSAQADIAQKSGVMLVRPLTYMRIENARSMKLLRSMITVEPKNVILVYPDIELPVGQVQFAVTNPRYNMNTKQGNNQHHHNNKHHSKLQTMSTQITNMNDN